VDTPPAGPLRPLAADPVPTPRTPAPAPAATGPFWHTRFADAQAAARREGKLILIGSTKPACGLCDKFKEQVFPPHEAEARQVVVGYMVNAMSPESGQAWQMLKDNLPTARLMPLVGIVTADLRWVTGFAGPTDEGMLLNALAQARRMVPAAAPAPVRPALPASAATASMPRRVTNEYGEPEWTPLADLYAEPEAVAAAPVADAARVDGPAADAVVPEPAPAVEPAPATAPVAAVEPAAPAPRWSDAPTHVAAAPAPVDDATLATALTTLRSPATSARVEATPPPQAPPTDAWAQVSLEEARAAIAARDFARARALLAEVNARLPSSALAREAARGTAALWHAERLAEAAPGEQAALRAQAERNFRTSLWASLFAL
jgi:hypothetical protein